MDGNVQHARDAAFGKWCRERMQAAGPIKAVSPVDVWCLHLPAVPRDAGLEAAITIALKTPPGEP